MKHHPPQHYVKMRPIVLNNPPDTKYHSSKGVLVVPRRLKKRATTITVSSKNITVNGKEKTVIDQRKRLSDYFFNLYKSRRKTSCLNPVAPVDNNIKLAKNENLWSK